MRVILTGATGFIGSRLHSFLLSKNYQVLTLTRSDNQEAIDRKMREFKPDVVLHLATLFISEHKSGDIEPLIQSNITFGTWVLEAMVNNKVHALVNTGTLWQYYEDKVDVPSSLYSATKSAFESILKFYCSSNPLKVINLMLSDTFGPQDSRPKLLPKLLKMAGSNECLELSPGEQIVEWTHVDDVVAAFHTAAQRLVVGGESQNFIKYTATSNQAYSLKETVKICEEVTGKHIKVVFGAKPYRAREIMRPSKLDAQLPGWQAKVQFREGLRGCLCE